MSKRTEQRLRRQIRDLEKRLAVCQEVALAERREHVNSYRIEQAEVYITPIEEFPEWLQATCRTAWAAGGHVAMMRSGDNIVFRFERRIYS